MNQLPIILLASWLAGLAAFVGGYIAKLEGNAETRAKREIDHAIIAFGGGILLAAVSFAMLPQAIEALGPLPLGAAFCAGGLIFCLVDIYLSRQGGNQAQLLAMLMDFVPEALALGAVFGRDVKLGLLLAAFIGIQNLPEGYNSYREMAKVGAKPRHSLGILLAASVLGPLAASTGYFFLQDQAGLTAVIMAFASGGILYLIFQDIAPQSSIKRHWTPALGAVLGFALGLLGKKLIG
jgi:zinc transporter, ZIP family